MRRVVVVLAPFVFGACGGSSVSQDETRSGDDASVTTSTAAVVTSTTTAPCADGASECTVIYPCSELGADVCGILGPDGCEAVSDANCTPVSYTKSDASDVVVNVPPCPGPPATLPTAGQAIAPVQIPCYCPSQPLTDAGGEDLDAVVDAALSWAAQVRGWDEGAGRLDAVYKVGDTTQGDFGDVFAYQVMTYCGQDVASASYGVELFNPAVHNTGSQADVVVAHFDSGWQVWGAYHP